MADNETPEVGTFDALDTAPEGDERDYTGYTPEETPEFSVDILTTPDTAELQLAELRAIRELLGIQVSQFAQVVGIVTELAGKADALFGGDGGAAPQLSGPAGMILSALIPKRR